MCSSFVLCFSAYRLQKVGGTSTICVKISVHWSVFLLFFLQVGIQENPSQFFVLVLALIVMTLQIFLPCYCGNEVIIHSNALTNAIYSSDWLQRSASVRKYIFIYMEFLKKPVRIRVGNFFDIGLPLFTKVSLRVHLSRSIYTKCYMNWRRLYVSFTFRSWIMPTVSWLYFSIWINKENIQ